MFVNDKFDKQYCLKLVKYNNILVWLEYELPTINFKKRKLNIEYNKQDSSEKSIYRSTKKIQEALLCNPCLDKFVTLTFAKIYNYTKQLYIMKLYTERLRTYIKYPLKYLTVPEYGARNGRFHFHMVTNQPYIKKSKLSELWGNGFVQINLINDSMQIAHYLTKYLTKDFKIKSQNRKLYYVSKNLDKPIIYMNDDALSYYMKNKQNLKLSKDENYKHPFLGTVKKLTYVEL